MSIDDAIRKLRYYFRARAQHPHDCLCECCEAIEVLALACRQDQDQKAAQPSPDIGGSMTMTDQRQPGVPDCEERAIYRQLLMTWAEALEQTQTRVPGFDEDRMAHGLRKAARLLFPGDHT